MKLLNFNDALLKKLACILSAAILACATVPLSPSKNIAYAEQSSTADKTHTNEVETTLKGKELDAVNILNDLGIDTRKLTNVSSRNNEVVACSS